MSISDDRLRWLSGPDYIRSESGKIAAELLAARVVLRKFLACSTDKRLNQWGPIIEAQTLLKIAPKLEPGGPDNSGWGPG